MILITGASGQLGDALVKLCRERGIAHAAVARPEFDFEKPETIAACFAAAKPDFVINAAAYTAVDKAETDQEAAKAGNHTGPLALAKLCEGAGIPFIHVSTDYVFDGNKGAPYVETDPTGPTGVYGATKRDGEEAILASGAKAVILRTAWVYAAHGKNFARTMLNAGRKMPQLRVVADQRGTPTAAPDLAAAILAIVEKISATGWEQQYRGIFHATGAGETTWHGFATAIFAEAAKHGYKAPDVQAIATADWPTPTRRPPDSRLDCSKLARIFGVTLPDWQASLPGIVTALLILDAAG
ncbi:MAG: dTDP-4-dehydrorhamnose reductase [Acidocella sp.]|uniref:dTDP-4-dehydrorhamnose reductase n=1 Tax=Acidocella sp. TaxID=50710 RepID=UPI003FC6BEBF